MVFWAGNYDALKLTWALLVSVWQMTTSPPLTEPMTSSENPEKYNADPDSAEDAFTRAHAF